MVFKMIFRHWQSRVNSNSAANVVLIQHVRRRGNQVILLGSTSFSVLLPAATFYPLLVWGPLPHFSHLFIFSVVPCPDSAQTQAGVYRARCLPFPPRESWSIWEVVQSFWEGGTGDEGSLPWSPKEQAARLRSLWKHKLWALFVYYASHLTMCALMARRPVGREGSRQSRDENIHASTVTMRQISEVQIHDNHLLSEWDLQKAKLRIPALHHWHTYISRILGIGEVMSWKGTLALLFLYKDTLSCKRERYNLDQRPYFWWFFWKENNRMRSAFHLFLVVIVPFFFFSFLFFFTVVTYP